MAGRKEETAKGKKERKEEGKRGRVIYAFFLPFPYVHRVGESGLKIGDTTHGSTTFQNFAILSFCLVASVSKIMTHET